MHKHFYCLWIRYLFKWFRHDFTWKDFLFGTTQLSKNVDVDKCFYPEYGFGFDPRFDFGKNTIIFSVEHSWSAQADNKKKATLVLDEGPMEGLYDATMAAEIT